MAIRAKLIRVACGTAFCSSAIFSPAAAEEHAEHSLPATFAIEVGVGSEVLVDTQLTVTEDDYDFRQETNALSENTCVDEQGEVSQAVIGRTVEVEIIPTDGYEHANETGLAYYLKVTLSVGEDVSYSDPSSPCSQFIQRTFSSSVARVVDHDFEGPVRLEGDNGLYLEVTPL